jgi:hypothetical protein
VKHTETIVNGYKLTKAIYGSKRMMLAHQITPIFHIETYTRNNYKQYPSFRVEASNIKPTTENYNKKKPN